MEKVELRYWLEHQSDEKNMNKLVYWKAFVDTYGIKSADLKNKLKSESEWNAVGMLFIQTWQKHREFFSQKSIPN